MTNKIIKVRRIQKENYTFILHLPDYIGEVGILGLEVNPYISIQTPENCFGYNDTVLYDIPSKQLYTLNRHLQPWIKKELLKTYKILEEKYLSMEAYEKLYNEIKNNKPLWNLREV